MRRFLTLVCLLGLALPAGISISGCVRNPAGAYCNGLGYGLKDNVPANLTLQPEIAGISLAYGQTTAISQPTATTCKGDSASISGGSLSYGTSNNQLIDISPQGNVCAGTWNRNSGGGIADYTYCNFPNPLPSTNGLPYAIAYITASADSITSNPVTVYVHAPISSINLVTEPLPGSPSQGCYSQNDQASLDAQAYYSLNGTPTLLCAPGSATLPECSNSIGTLNFSSGNSTVATIDPTKNVITAQQPGTTVITATIAESASSAGYFSTCPPQSIAINLANGTYKGVIAQGAVQNLITKAIDTLGKPISGLTLDYESTNPIEVNTTGSGSITASFPGVATLTALCKPPLCNPAPINELGLNGTGLSITSNPVEVIVPGTTSDFVWFAAPNQSQYFSSIELLTGTPGSTVRMPFVPNSMVMDQAGSSLYFGSPRELMIYSTQSNTLTRQDSSVPGVVLAASPNSNYLLINDQIRGIFYLYNTSGSSGSIVSTFGGLGAAAAWTQDSNTLYVVDSAALGGNHTNTLYVHDTNSGWSTYSLNASGGAQDLAITVPGVGAYLSGNSTVAHTWCPSGTVGNNATIQFYPQSDSVNLVTNILGATSDGQHILGASLNGTSITLDDIGVSLPPPTPGSPAAECPVTTVGTTQTLTPLSTNPTLNGSVNLTGVTDATAVNQVVTGAAPTTASVTTATPVAFVTYNTPSTSTTAAPLPFYLPQPSGPGAFGYVTFADSTSATPPTAPLAGTFSPDHSIFFVSTAGDNEIHFIGIPPNLSLTSPPTDTQQVSPALPACTPVSAGGNDAGCLYPAAPAPNAVVPATVITVKPRSIT